MKVYHKKRICFFGRYNAEYPRINVLKGGFIENGASVVECKTELRGIKKYLDLIKKHRILLNQYDILLVPFSGWYYVFLAKFLTKKPIIFDALVSIYDSMVFDRRIVKQNSIKAKYFWLVDWLACKLADNIILDTNEHIKYFIKEFGVDEKKIIKVPLSAMHTDETYSKIKPDKFIVHHHGYLVPLQGVEYILEAANILRNHTDIHFNIIGSQTKKKYSSIHFNNVSFIDDIQYVKLLEYISIADICLGIFGNTNKARRVISFKIFEYISMKKPVITSDTLAVRELFNGNNLKLIQDSNPRLIAEAILLLKNNTVLCDRMSSSSYKIFKQELSPKILSKRILDVCS